MRFLNAVAVSSLLFAGSLHAGTVVDDDDDDWADFETETFDEEAFDASNFAPKQDSSLAAAADAFLSAPQRKIRMALCIGLVRQKFASAKEDMQAVIAQVAQMQQVSEEQAAESIHIMMLKNCYINIDQASDLKALVEGDKFDEVADRLVAKPAGEEEGAISTFTDYQWELIKDFLENEKKTKSENGGGGGGGSTGGARMEVIGSKMGTLQKLLYFLAVFGSIFGGGYILVKKLMQYELEKSQKRGKKAEKKLAAETASSSTKKTD